MVQWLRRPPPFLGYLYVSACVLNNPSHSQVGQIPRLKLKAGKMTPLTPRQAMQSFSWGIYLREDAGKPKRFLTQWVCRWPKSALIPLCYILNSKLPITRSVLHGSCH